MREQENIGSAAADMACTSGALGGQEKEAFRLSCKMLRNAGKLDFRDLPQPRRSESIIDWLVRVGIAQTPSQAADGLLTAAGLKELHGELMSEMQS